MNDSRKAALTAAVAAGYLLGRTRKGKVALTLASVAAGRRLSVSPQDLLMHGVRTLKESPQFGRLSEQVRGELTQSGRTALTTATDHTFNSLADRVQRRTQALQEVPGGTGPPAGTGQQEGEEQQEEGGTDSGGDAAESPPDTSPARGADQGVARQSSKSSSARPKSSAEPPNRSSAKSESTSSRKSTSSRTRRR